MLLLKWRPINPRCKNHKLCSRLASTSQSEHCSSRLWHAGELLLRTELFPAQVGNVLLKQMLARDTSETRGVVDSEARQG